MTKQPTKEELISQIAIAKTRVDEYLRRDEEIRKELSQMLQSPSRAVDWGSGSQRLTYTWPQIYFELGKLRNKSDEYIDFRMITKGMEERLRRLEDPELLSNPTHNG